MATFAFICFVVGLALAAQNKKGVFNAEDGQTWHTDDVTASFGLLSNLLGMVLVVTVFLLDVMNYYDKRAIVMWLFFCGLLLFFLCGVIGIWCQKLNSAPYLRIWAVELGFEVFSSFFFILLMLGVVSTLQTKAVEAK